MITTTIRLFRTLALLLTMAAGGSVWAQSFTIEASYNVTDRRTTYTIRRSGSNLPAQTINYRTVNLSAYAGQHYTAKSGTETFSANETYRLVQVTERTPDEDAYAFLYQTGNSRSYRFEVLDVNGFRLAYYDRSMTTGTQFSNAKVSREVTDLVYFNGTSYASGMSSSKYIDVSYTPPSNQVQGSNQDLSGYVLIDDSYDYTQKQATVSTSMLINSTGATASYLKKIGYEIYATVCFTEKERDDGYQYVQIVAGDANHSYDGADPNGQVYNPDNSVYKACYELADGSNSEGKAFFPHRYNCATRTSPTGCNQNSSHTEFYLATGKLWQQKYRTGFDAANSGSIRLNADVSNITTRFDAAGDNDDTWGYKDLFVRMALCDATKPTLYNNTTNGITVSAGPYVNGNTFYISVPFSEIVHITGAPKGINTTWGYVYYESGDSTNVITFKGTINASANTVLSITEIYGCVFSDLAGNGDSFNATSFNKTFTGVRCSATYTLAATNTSFSGLDGDYWVSDGIVHPQRQPVPTVYFYKGIKNNANKVTLTRNTDYTLTWGNNTSAGNGSVTATGTGIYTSSASTTFPIRWATYTVRFHANDGTYGTQATEDQLFTYNSAQNLSSTLTREGYTVARWTTQADGTGTSYGATEEVLNLSAVDGTVIDLYAQWAVIPWTGSGDNTDDPYMILYASQLDSLAATVNSGTGYDNKFFKLGANITYPHTTDWDDEGSTEDNYTAIGNHLHKFSGTFDGDHKTISGIRIYKPAQNEQGLFGVLWNATVKNINLSDARIKGGASDCGGIVGYCWYNTTISGCVVTQTRVDCSSHSKGAIVGENYSANTLAANYYRGCIVGGASTGVGVGGTNAPGDQEGARSVHTLGLPADVTASGESIEIDDVTYYASNTPITLTYSGTPGYSVSYGYNDGSDHAISGHTFTMPAADITVSATLTNRWGVGTGHDGTSESTAYLISDTAGLNLLARYVNGTDGYPANAFDGRYFKLGNNITYSHESLGSTESNYTAIGANGHIFSGTFDGQGDTISGIRIYKGNDSYQGLFGQVSNGTIKNVTLDDARITGQQEVGGIAGYLSGQLQNCLVTGTNIGGTDNVGAVVGDIADGSTCTTNYYRGCTVNGSEGVANVGSGNMGDIAGIRSLHTLTLGTDISATGSETKEIGGVTYYASASTITLTYGGTVPMGYVLGFHYNDGSAHTVSSNSFTMPAADVNVSTTLTDVWGLTATPAADGTANHPYIITDTTGLNVLAKCVNGTHGYIANGFSGTVFKLGADISYSTVELGENESNYTAIGYEYNHAFHGTFDGDGRTVSGIRIHSDNENQGLFGYIDGGTVKNVILANSTISSGENAGGIVGYERIGLVTNCRVENDVTIGAENNNYDYHGGIVGYIQWGNGIVSGCVSGASIIGTGHYYGGIAGMIVNGTVKDCLFSGSVANGAWKGAIAGGNSGTLSNNYYTSNNNGGVNGSDRDGARRARTLTLGENLALEGDQTAYTLSGLTAIGTTVLGHTVAETTTLYSGASQTVSFSYTGQEVPAGYLLEVKYNDGSDHMLSATEGVYSFGMPDANVAVSARIMADINYWWHADNDHDGTSEERAYIITAPTGLDLLAREVNNGNSYRYRYFKLGADIAYDPNSVDEGGENYTAIGCKYSVGNMSENRAFCGTFDGCGHTVSGIRINKSGNQDWADEYQGLFGLVEGTVKNVTLADADITGWKCVGGIVGALDEEGWVENCHVTGNVALHAVQNAAYYFGGIVGFSHAGGSDRSTIAGCSSAATLTVADGLTGCTYFGGIAGCVEGELRDCLVHGASIPDLHFTNQYIDHDASGAIAGDLSSDYTVSHNYYRDVAIGGESTGIGIGHDHHSNTRNDIATDDGAVAAYTLTLGEHISAEPAAPHTFSDGDYYVVGTTVTLSVEGYTLGNEGYTVRDARGNDVPLTDGNTFVMPESDVTVSATLSVIPWGGNGTENDPYIIIYRSQLDLLAERVNSHTGEDQYGYSGKFFKLGADISYPHTTAWDDASSTENNYTAIGTDDYPFRGTFDGDGHTVIGIRIYKGGDVYSDSYQGLFGKTYGTVKNVTLTDARITGNDYVGGIVGNANGGTVQDCRVTATVAIHAVAEGASFHGGIVGENDCTVSGCSSAARLTVADGFRYCNDYGGIVGYNSHNHVIRNCIAMGARVSGSNYVGAIVGYDHSNGTTPSHNYYHGCTVNGSTGSGVGCGNPAGDITANEGAMPCYRLAIPTVVSTGSTAIINHEGQHYVAAGQTVTLVPIYAGYTIGSLTYNDGSEHIIAGNSFSMPTHDITVSVNWAELPEWSGSGTLDDPWMITTCAELDALAIRVNGGNKYRDKWFKLGADISYAHTTDWNDNTSTENNYTAIGGAVYDSEEDDWETRTFRGTFDGDGHTISGIRIYKGGETNGDKYQGLFGLTNTGYVHSVTLTDTRITGYQSVGGIIGGDADFSEAVNCHVTSTVAIHAVANGSRWHGGIAGDMEGECNYCTSAATLSVAGGVTGCEYFGGVVGYSAETTQNNLALGVSISGAAERSGAIVGVWNRRLENNYYRNCSYGGATENIGTGEGDVLGNDFYRAGPAQEMSVTIPGYGEGRGGWHFISVPMYGNRAPRQVENLIVEPAANYDLYSFEEGAAGAEWKNYKSHKGLRGKLDDDGSRDEVYCDFFLYNWLGYLYASKETVTLTFLGHPITSDSYNTSASLRYTEGNPFAGWNLIGNPLTVPAYADHPYYRMNAEGDGLEACPTSEPLAVFEGAMVHIARDRENVNFTSTAPSGKSYLNLKLCDREGRQMDNAVVEFGGEHALEKNETLNSQFSSLDAQASLSISRDGKCYAVAAVSDTVTKVPMAFEGPAGTYTISHSSNQPIAYCHLIDLLTGADIDLLRESTYGFTHSDETSTVRNRFLLVFSPTADIQSAHHGDFARQDGDQLIVSGTGTLQAYDIMGRELFLRELGSKQTTIPAALFPAAGVYLLRLGDQSQKIVVK